MSKQKKAILEALQSSEGHLRADEIFSRVRQIIPNISVGTVYRNLGVLLDEGVIHRISVPDGGDVYDKTPFPHGHLICTECSKVFDLPIEELSVTDGIIERVRRLGNEVRSYNFTVGIICSDCQKQ